MSSPWAIRRGWRTWSRRWPVIIRRFFFYGTLIAGSGSPVAACLHRKLRPLGPATMRGLLYAVPDPDGWYPALLSGEGAVAGQLYMAAEDFGAADLALLDAYEGPDYRRTDVALESGAGTAEAYLWQGALPAGAVPIPEGDFAAFLRATGNRAYLAP